MILATEYLLRGILDVIAPARCLSCLKENTWLCQACAKDLPIFSQRCIVCDKEKPRGITCAHHGKKKPLTGVISAGGYGWPHIQRGVHWLKFRRITEIAPILARLITPTLGLIAPLASLQEGAVLIPIPLHPRRFRQRGFNQSTEIATSLSDQTGIPVADVLTRERATASQTELPHEMREENMKEAFVLKPHFAKATRGRRYFLLLDDVTTTGSTLSAAAEVLKIVALRPQHSRGEQARVWGVTVARG